MKIGFLGNFGIDYSSENHHKRSLEALGHTVVPFQELSATDDQVLEGALACDIFIWIHTHSWQTNGTITMRRVLEILKENKIPTLTYHLDLWLGLERQKEMNQDDYWSIEHFFTVDKLMADWLNKNTQVKGHYLLAGVYDQECYMAQPSETQKFDVIFVGSRGYHNEWPFRPQMVDWLKATYKEKFAHYGGDGLGTIRGAALNQLYANTKIAVGDSLNLNFDYPFYSSDRKFEAPGRGAFQIYPRIEGLDDAYKDGVETVLYKHGDFGDLKNKIDYYLEHDIEREEIRLAGHERTKKDHTYLNRWKTILETIK